MLFHFPFPFPFHTGSVRQISLQEEAYLVVVLTAVPRPHYGGPKSQDTDLKGANLSNAKLLWTYFGIADLSGANLTKARMGWTSFEAQDLRLIKGLETIELEGPSFLSITTIYRSRGNIPEAFLKGAGIPDTFISYARSLVSRPIDYYRCFISYSSRDEPFAKRLYADLQSNGVRCWVAPEDLKIGSRIRPSIDESIRLYDKLLLVLSEYSVASQWVEQEVERALARERKENKVILFPIRPNTYIDTVAKFALSARREGVHLHKVSLNSW